MIVLMRNLSKFTALSASLKNEGKLEEFKNQGKPGKLKKILKK